MPLPIISVWFDAPTEDETDDRDPRDNEWEPTGPVKRMDWDSLRKEQAATDRAAIAYVRALDWWDGPFGVWAGRV